MHDIVLIPGDGIGPEITDSVTTILKEAGAEINWLEHIAGLEAYDEVGNPLPDDTLEALKEYKLALKGPLTTPVGSGFRSVNVALRKELQLYSNIRPAKTLPHIESRFDKVDLVMFRENTEGLYIGKEQWVEENSHAESIAVVTRRASEKIIRAAFQYARNNNRHKLTLVHKANILKYTCGLFLEVGHDVAKEFPDIHFEDLIVDNMAMQMVMRPEQFDVIVTTNLFGDILSDLASGLIGGLGLTGAANIGDDAAMFEAVHGSAPDIAGQNKANPTAFLLSALMMLEHIGENRIAKNIRNAIYKTLADKSVCTPDIGGSGSTETYTRAVCDNL
ncbi:isocitrate/isopropylmalate dehydrogenase family protein [Balneolaceae bacterium YR4-1]|uniref:Isocitrate/isopropylmalate dehydrogenase family protein n=1 Tax=Halalkalibaculum roseum TaxID=2709311 RepID=A0A6M1SWM9_9BACT|nr:isocitrate/isopropylmalate dehydrogenase family protein [Halalkalibaculum roseum]NGP77460.1 isocitrate/isopropylmalate dehydrogenase family protein [Halalkalibaculum roseum]